MVRLGWQAVYSSVRLAAADPREPRSSSSVRDDPSFVRLTFSVLVLVAIAAHVAVVTDLPGGKSGRWSVDGTVQATSSGGGRRAAQRRRSHSSRLRSAGQRWSSPPDHLRVMVEQLVEKDSSERSGGGM